jgi:nifR3 family TIM-barrel protein
MAGVTNPPFRTLCRRYGAGLYVSEMITARALVEGNRKTLLLASFAPEESVRSLQLYGTDPRYVGEAVRFLAGEAHIDHLDMNFGCPVRKVTSKGGGAAVPLKPRLLRAIVRAAVEAAGAIPVTLKFRIGLDERYETCLEAGRIGQEEGCAAVALHARTAAQLYDGEADWSAIARLKAAVTRIPVLGNGDVWEAADALRMMRTTGCDGVVVGRGCLGRPWLFRDLAQIFEGQEPEDPPRVGVVVDVMLEHARLLCAWLGEENAALRAFRKHASWYTKCFPGSAPLRQRLMQVATLSELESTLSVLDPDLPYPPEAMRVPRGKTSGTQRVALPEGYLDNLDDDTSPSADADADGG